MSIARFLAVAISGLSIVIFGGCSRKTDFSFSKEQTVVQAAFPSQAELGSSAGPKQTGNTIESSWSLQYPGSMDSIKREFESRLPSEYKLVRGDERESHYAKFDGHDEFDLALGFENTNKKTTAIQVVLTSFPD